MQAGMTHRKCISTAQSVASSSTCASSRVHQCSVCCSPTIRGRVFSVTPLLPLWWLVMGDVAPVCMARQSTTNAEQYRDCKREIMAARVQSVISGRAQKRRMFPRINVCCSLMQCTRWKLRCAKMSLIYYSMDLWNAAYAVHFISNLKAD